MVFHTMKTTLNLDEGIMRRLKARAAREGRTLSELVEPALRLFLRAKKEEGDLPPLPTFDGGALLVDSADRDALYRAMEEE